MTSFTMPSHSTQLRHLCKLMATASSYECSLQGIVPTVKLRETLLQRLVGFCGKDSQMDLYEHEVGFTPAGIRIMYHSLRFRVAEPIQIQN